MRHKSHSFSSLGRPPSNSACHFLSVEFQWKAITKPSVCWSIVLSLTALPPLLLAMTAKCHSAALNDRRENDGQDGRGRFDPQFPTKFGLEWIFLSFLVTVNVSSGLSPEIPCDKVASGTVGRRVAHLGLLDEVHKYWHGSLIILSHRRSGDTLYGVTPWKSLGSRLGTLARNLRCDILCVFVTKCLAPRQALLAFIQSAPVRHVYGL